jgi:hypothetical protein
MMLLIVFLNSSAATHRGSALREFYLLRTSLSCIYAPINALRIIIVHIDHIILA